MTHPPLATGASVPTGDDDDRAAAAREIGRGPPGGPPAALTTHWEKMEELKICLIYRLSRSITQLYKWFY